MATLVEEQRTEIYSPEAEAGPSTGERLRAVTVGGAVAVAIVGVAALLRLFALESQPLGGAEAARALLALRFVQGQPADLTGFSPLLTNLNLLVFFLAGGSDFWARLVPALFGIALVALPFFRFRQRLGTSGALAASVLLALSPTFLLFSRSVAPAVLTAVTSLIFVGAIFDYVDSRERRDLLIAAGALALALTAGPGIYTVLLFLLIFGIGAWLRQRNRGGVGEQRSRGAEERKGKEAEEQRSGGAEGRRSRGAEEQGSGGAGEHSDQVADNTKNIAVQATSTGRNGVGAALSQYLRTSAPGHPGLVFGVVFVVASTGFLVNFGGIQAALNLFVDWLRSFSLVREYPIWYYPGVLALYEPAILLFGLLGAVIAVRRRDRFGTFLATWFAGSLVLYTLVGATEPALVVPILLPLVLLAGRGVASLFEFANTDEPLNSLLVAAFVTPLMVFVLLQLAFYAETAGRSVYLYLALGGLVMAVIVGMVFASSRFGMAWRPATAGRGLGMGLLLVALGLSVHMAWQLNLAPYEPVRELLFIEPTSTDMREMVSVLETVSQDRLGDTVSLPITVDSRLSPIVPWYLQDFTHVNVVDDVRQPPTNAGAVIVPKTDEMPPIGDQYVGQAFRLSSRWRPVNLTGAEFAQWYFYREGPAAPADELIVFVTR